MGIPLAQRRKMRLTVYHLWEATVSNRPAQQLTSSQGDLDQFSQQIIRNTTLGETLREETLIISCYHLRISTLASGYSLSRSLIHSFIEITHTLICEFTFQLRPQVEDLERRVRHDARSSGPSLENPDLYLPSPASQSVLSFCYLKW